MHNSTIATEWSLSLARVSHDHSPAPTEADRAAVNDILVDCLFAVGQAVGTRKTLDYDAAQWWRQHYNAKFLRAMSIQGNRWAMDRDAVTGVAMLFGERAVRYAGDADSITVEAFQRAAADVERYCHALAARKARSTRDHDQEQPLSAGYWCTF